MIGVVMTTSTARTPLPIGRSVLAPLLLLVASLITSWSGSAGAATRPLGSNSSDASKARQMNLRQTDLPTSQKWASSPTPASQVALGKTAVSCMKASGGAGAKISPDPFGTVGKSIGNATADVSSNVFGIKGSFTGLPSASSEVVFVKTTKEALADLAAFGTAWVQACLATLVAKVTQLSSGGSPKSKVSALSLPHLGGGSGGVHLQFVTTGGEIPGKLYQDVFYYVEGRAEVALTYVNLAASFPSGWASSIAKNVMARAKSIAG